MPSLLITVFVLQLVIHLVNTVGATGINHVVRLNSSPRLCSWSLTDSVAAVGPVEQASYLDLPSSRGANTTSPRSGPLEA